MTDLPKFALEFRALVARNPDGVALIDARNGPQWTYGALDHLVSRVGHWLEVQKLSPGDTILSLLPNSVEALTIFLAALRYGYHLAPLPPGAAAREIDRLHSLVQSRLIIALPDLALPGHLLEGVGLRQIATDGRFLWLPDDRSRPEIARYDRKGKLLIATSGSTGEPKVMVIDGDTLWAAGKAFVSENRFVSSSDRFYNIMPVSYLGGLFNLGLLPLAAGASVVVADAFSGVGALRFWPDISRFGVTVLWLVPTMIHSLLAVTARRGQVDRSTVRTSFLGTAPIDLKTKTKFEATFGIDLLENYALSETTFLTSETLETRGQRVEGSVGEPLRYADINLAPLEADGADASYREIRIRSPFLFDGYLGPDGSIALPCDADGYFRTGDLGHFDSGRLVLDGRRKDVVKKGGILVNLPEIESLAGEHPAVAEAAAAGVPHDFYGEDYVLFLRLSEGFSEASVDDVRTFLCENLIRSKWPSDIRLIAELPRTRSGKIAKGELIKLARRQTRP